jgi:hypothetical protein
VLISNGSLSLKEKTKSSLREITPIWTPDELGLAAPSDEVALPASPLCCLYNGPAAFIASLKLALGLLDFIVAWCDFTKLFQSGIFY